MPLASLSMQALFSRFGVKLSSTVWHLLTRYGQFKYRYLLPVYRLLRLMPKERNPSGTAKPSLTLRSAQALTCLLNRSDRQFYRGQLNALIEGLQSRKGAVIFLPSLGWEIMNTQRSHHLAREFARQGYVSIYDCTNAYDDVDGFKEIEPNLFLFRGDEALLHEIPNALLWALPYNFERKDNYPQTARAIYDWIDDLEVFPYNSDFLERNHRRALQEATLVTSVARRLHEQALRVREDALYLPNGVEYEHFAGDAAQMKEEPELMKFVQEGKPIAGYYGALAEWFDYELLEEVARRRRDWNFLLIGPKYDLSLSERGQPLLKLGNVRWIGHRSYQSLPSYLRLFDVAMIPFVLNPITLATSPLKLYEYFAGGKAVITTPMPECESFPEVSIARNAEEFAQALDPARAQGLDAEFRRRLRELAQQNSWQERVRVMMRHLQTRQSASTNAKN